MNTGALILDSGDGPPDIHPPRNEVAGILTGPPYIVRGPVTAVIIPFVQVFSTGLLIEVSVRFRADDTPEEAQAELRRLMTHNYEPGERRLHIALRYPDGTVTQNLHTSEPSRPGSTYRAALLQHASSSGPQWKLGYWVRSRPTSGTVQLSVGWPAQQIGATDFTFTSADVTVAAARIRDPWA
jgi:hypothetical protein